MVGPAAANSQLRRTVEVFLIAILVIAFAVTPALAKGPITVSVADRTPGVGQPFAVDVRTGFVVPANDWLRLVAVAPGKDWYQVVGTVTGDASRTHANITFDGFEITLKRIASRHWRAPSWRLCCPTAPSIGRGPSCPSARSSLTPTSSRRSFSCRAISSMGR